MPPTDDNIIFPPNSEADLPTGVTRHATAIPTAADIKSLYLWGCKITDKNGTEMPDAVIDMHINNAVSFLEHYLNICIWPTKFIENKDFRAESYSSWNFLSLNRSPVISIESFKVKFISTVSTLDFPAEWYRLYTEMGQIQLTPTAGTLNQWSLAAGGVILLPQGFMARKDFPQLFEITYIAGFEEEKIPFIINSLISLWASVHILAMLDNVVISPGIAGLSIGLDGLSHSVSKNPQSAYMGLISTYLERFNAEAAVARNFYKKLSISVI